MLIHSQLTTQAKRYVSVSILAGCDRGLSGQRCTQNTAALHHRKLHLVAGYRLPCPIEDPDLQRIAQNGFCLAGLFIARYQHQLSGCTCFR